MLVACVVFAVAMLQYEPDFKLRAWFGIFDSSFHINIYRADKQWMFSPNKMNKNVPKG